MVTDFIRDFTGISDEVTFVGRADHFQLWAAASISRPRRRRHEESAGCEVWAPDKTWRTEWRRILAEVQLMPVADRFATFRFFSTRCSRRSSLRPARSFSTAPLGRAAIRRPFSTAGADVIALDRDPTAIAAGQALVAAIGGHLTLVHSQFSELADHAPAGRARRRRARYRRLLHADRRGRARLLVPEERPARHAHVGCRRFRRRRRQSRQGRRPHPHLPASSARRSRRGRIARAIEKRRAEKPFETTRDLAGLIELVTPRKMKDKIHPATRVFQALRIFVNDELGELAQALFAAERALKPGGRLVVVTFHSLEDRIVKKILLRPRRQGRRARAICRSRMSARRPSRQSASRWLLPARRKPRSIRARVPPSCGPACAPRRRPKRTDMSIFGSAESCKPRKAWRLMMLRTFDLVLIGVMIGRGRCDLHDQASRPSTSSRRSASSMPRSSCEETRSTFCGRIGRCSTSQPARAPRQGLIEQDLQLRADAIDPTRSAGGAAGCCRRTVPRQSREDATGAGSEIPGRPRPSGWRRGEDVGQDRNGFGGDADVVSLPHYGCEAPAHFSHGGNNRFGTSGASSVDGSRTQAQRRPGAQPRRVMIIGVLRLAYCVVGGRLVQYGDDQSESVSSIGPADDICIASRPTSSTAMARSWRPTSALFRSMPSRTRSSMRTRRSKSSRRCCRTWTSKATYTKLTRSSRFAVAAAPADAEAAEPHPGARHSRCRLPSGKAPLLSGRPDRRRTSSATSISTTAALPAWRRYIDNQGLADLARDRHDQRSRSWSRCGCRSTCASQHDAARRAGSAPMREISRPDSRRRASSSTSIPARCSAWRRCRTTTRTTRPTARKDGWLNRMSDGTFEMGSTFKTFTTAMALDSGKVTLNGQLRRALPDPHRRLHHQGLPRQAPRADGAGNLPVFVQHRYGQDGRSSSASPAHKEFLTRHRPADASCRPNCRR